MEDQKILRIIFTLYWCSFWYNFVRRSYLRYAHCCRRQDGQQDRWQDHEYDEYDKVWI